MGIILETMGKKVSMAGADRAPVIYSFLPRMEKYQAGSPPKCEFDTLVVLDCSVPDRLGDGYKELLNSNLVVINLDHHISSVHFGRYNYIDPAASAVGEIMYDLINEMGLEITMDIALCLYTAIVTDTGSFQYDNTSPDTLRRVAKLMEIGVPAAKVNTLIYEERPKAVFDLLGCALSTLTASPCGKVCWMTVTGEMLQNAGAADEHTEGLVNYAKSIRGVQVGILFREIKEDSYKISFRSKDVVDVNRLATPFGGGGHPHAAGCSMQGNLNEIKEKVISAALQAVRGINQ
jgi:phosphoesterase RecJ-like protein